MCSSDLILTVYDVGEADGHVYIAMEYVAGRPLSEVVGERGLPTDEALRLGLINRVFAPEDVERETIAYAQTLCENAPLSIRASKFFINQLGLERAQRDEETIRDMQRVAANSEDFKEATRSFMEKRKPVFQGR